MRVVKANANDIFELYKLQLLAFESEAEMIGSRDVPALMETKEANENDFANWITLKLVSDYGEIIGAIRYRKNGDVIEVGRLMIHPNYRHQRSAQCLKWIWGVRMKQKNYIPVQRVGSTSVYTKKWVINLLR